MRRTYRCLGGYHVENPAWRAPQAAWISYGPEVALRTEADLAALYARYQNGGSYPEAFIGPRDERPAEFAGKNKELSSASLMKQFAELRTYVESPEISL